MENFKELITEGYGWRDLGPQKNRIMFSFVKEEDDENPLRMNFYFTTGTLTIQDRARMRNESFRKVDTLEKLEEILINI